MNQFIRLSKRVGQPLLPKEFEGYSVRSEKAFNGKLLQRRRIDQSLRNCYLNHQKLSFA